MTNFPVTDGFLVLQKFYLLAALDQLAKKDFPAARPISEMERNAELNFANIHPASSWTRLLPPTLIPVPAMHVRPCRYRRFPITKSIVIIFSRF
jgi:glucuronosyltransferase